MATCQAAKPAPNHAVIAQLRAGTIARLHAGTIARLHAVMIARVRMDRRPAVTAKRPAVMGRVRPARTAVSRAAMVRPRANRTVAASPMVAVSAAGANANRPLPN